MEKYYYTTQTAISAEHLYNGISDIGNWPKWDNGLATTSFNGPLVAGTRFTIKPKDGPLVAMELIEASAPLRFIDVAHLPLAKIRSSHFFTPQSNGTTKIEVNIEVFGLLGFLWDRLIARKLAQEAAEHTQAFLDYVSARQA
jgi:hypothetical protein